MASLEAIFQIDVLRDCKLCNHSSFFKEEMDKFINSVPLMYHRIFMQSLIETYHCIIHSRQHMWFFHMFKRNGQFLNGMYNTCSRMDTPIGKRVMEIITNVAEDRYVFKLYKIFTYKGVQVILL